MKRFATFQDYILGNVKGIKSQSILQQVLECFILWWEYLAMRGHGKLIWGSNFWNNINHSISLFYPFYVFLNLFYCVTKTKEVLDDVHWWIQTLLLQYKVPINQVWTAVYTQTDHWPHFIAPEKSVWKHNFGRAFCLKVDSCLLNLANLMFFPYAEGAIALAIWLEANKFYFWKESQLCICLSFPIR